MIAILRRRFLLGTASVLIFSKNDARAFDQTDCQRLDAVVAATNAQLLTVDAWAMTNGMMLCSDLQLQIAALEKEKTKAWTEFTKAEAAHLRSIFAAGMGAGLLIVSVFEIVPALPLVVTMTIASPTFLAIRSIVSPENVNAGEIVSDITKDRLSLLLESFEKGSRGFAWKATNGFLQIYEFALVLQSMIAAFDNSDVKAKETAWKHVVARLQTTKSELQTVTKNGLAPYRRAQLEALRDNATKLKKNYCSVILPTPK